MDLRTIGNQFWRAYDIEMNSEILFDYYSLLFSTEVAVFGIIGAAVLVFVQLVYSIYPYRQIGHVLRTTSLVLLLAISTLDLLATGAGVYLVSVERSLITNEYILFLSDLVVSPCYTLACFVLLLVSIVLFIVLVLQYRTYLSLHRAILLVTKKIRYQEIRDFLWKKYEPHPPYRFQFEWVPYDPMDKDLNEDEGGRANSSRIETEADDAEVDNSGKNIAINKRKVANTSDPFLPLRDLMILFVKRSDLTSLEESVSLLSEKSTEFLLEIPGKNDAEWRPEHELPMAMTKHLIGIVRILLEIIEKEGIYSARQAILTVTHLYAVRLIDLNFLSEFIELQLLWRNVADASILNSRLIFEQMVGYFGEFGTCLLSSYEPRPFDQGKDAKKEAIDEVLKSVGYLGERLISALPLEEKMLLGNHDNGMKFNVWFECLLGFGTLYRQKPSLYPLGYFNALIVMYKKSLQLYGAHLQRYGDVEKIILTAGCEFSSFAKEAVKARNVKGAELSVLELWRLYEELRDNGLVEQAHEVVQLLVPIGYLATIFQGGLLEREIFDEQIHDRVIKLLVESGEDVSEVVSRELLSVVGSGFGEGSYERAWGFLVDLGKRLKTNFGYNFDPATGELYSDDDPRRR